MNRTFYYFNHQNKGKAFADALIKSGWTQVNDYYGARICLADSDVTELRKDNLAKMHARGTRIFLYPHAARPPVHYDFEDYKPSGLAAAQFVVSKRHEDVLRAIGYEGAVHSVGWSYCPIVRFRSPEEIRRIVFAPVHANGTGWLHSIDKDLNRRAFERAHELASRRGAELTVRFLGSLEGCGVPRVAGVNYHRGEPDQSIADINWADLVIATQTFQYLAVASGKPTIGVGESVSPKIGFSEESFRWAGNWDKYRDLMAYPLDILDESTPLNDLVNMAVRENQAVEDWKMELIGSPFEPKLFVSKIESHLTQPVSLSV